MYCFFSKGLPDERLTSASDGLILGCRKRLKLSGWKLVIEHGK